MEYRRADRNDIASLTENRMEFIASIAGGVSDAEEFRNRTEAYIRAHIERGDLLIWIAVEHGMIVASCMLCIFETIPLPSCPSGKSAELLNVYTKKEYRKRGHAEGLLRMLLEEAKRHNVGKITLSYTKDGLSLYERLGFIHAEHRMEIRL